MTVQGKGAGDDVQCVWFEGEKELKTAVFAAGTLEKHTGIDGF